MQSKAQKCIFEAFKKASKASLEMISGVELLIKTQFSLHKDSCSALKGAKAVSFKEMFMLKKSAEIKMSIKETLSIVRLDFGGA